MCSSSSFRFLAAALLALAASAAQAGPGALADLEIYDRSAGRVLPVYWHHGQYYVAGEPGHEYELRLRSRDGGRLLAVTSVDGVNVISGETAATRQSGYVLDPYDALTVSGWRKSMSRIAAFYFTSLRDSYAARTGRPHDVGVIGVALFREARPHYRYQPDAEIGRTAPPPAAPGEGARSRRDEAAASAPADADGYAGAPPPRLQEKLGTGHGRSEWSSASYTQFERASGTPDEVLTIHYDSHANLLAQGVIPAPPLHPHRPRAFPAGFVPDP